MRVNAWENMLSIAIANVTARRVPDLTADLSSSFSRRDDRDTIVCLRPMDGVAVVEDHIARAVLGVDVGEDGNLPPPRSGILASEES